MRRDSEVLGRALDFVDSRLREPITIGDLAMAAGMHPRSLQRLFVRQLGTQPMEWVKQRRLTVARDTLLRGSRGLQVVRVALDLGFPHLGRFAAAYRSAFGELPSQTLRRQSGRAVRAPPR